MGVFVLTVCILYTFNLLVTTIKLGTEGANFSDLMSYAIVCGITCWGWTVYLQS
jgi:hypothetical protein